MAVNDRELCPRCGQMRLPASWYTPGNEWLGHGRAPCIGADRNPRHPSHDWFIMGDGTWACHACQECPCDHDELSTRACMLYR